MNNDELKQIALFASCCVRSKIHVSQLAVLLTIALNPGCRLGKVVEETGLTAQHACRIINYLIDTGDVEAQAGNGKRRIYYTTELTPKTLEAITSTIGLRKRA